MMDKNNITEGGSKMSDKVQKTIKGVIPGESYPNKKVMELRASAWDKFPDPFLGCENMTEEDYTKELEEAGRDRR